MLLRSVQINSVISVKVKGVISLKMLENLIRKAQLYTNGRVFAAVFTVSFFGFFRLSTLLPNKISNFEKSRFPIENDIVVGPPGMHIIVTCSKTMQSFNQVQFVQLPVLESKNFCTVKAMKDVLKSSPRGKTDQYFRSSPRVEGGWVPLTAPCVRSFLKLIIVAMGLNPRTYTCHAFRHSGASLAFDNNIELNKIKQHGN